MTSRVWLVAAVLVTAMIGNWRVAASSTPSASADGPARLEIVSDHGSTRATVAAPADPDGAQLVPAIYAWDPEVRFVYYRHVSKWM